MTIWHWVMIAVALLFFWPLLRSAAFIGGFALRVILIPFATLYSLATPRREIVHATPDDTE